MLQTAGADASTARPLVARRALLVINPKARQGRTDIAPAIHRLEAAGLTVVQETFRTPGEASEDIVRRNDDMDLVIVCGGDGTINAAARGIMTVRKPMGILPLGTANDLARTLGIPVDPVAAADVIAAGLTRRIDVGEVNGHPFFNVASIGLSAELARSLTPDVKRRWGRFGYAVAAFWALAAARPFTATIRSATGSEATVRTMQIAIGNGVHYGGGNVVDAAAAIDDGHLDLYSLEVGSVWKLAFMLPAFRNGRHGAWKEVRTERCTAFDIETRRRRPVNTDGELVTFTPAHVRVIPDAIEVFARAS